MSQIPDIGAYMAAVQASPIVSEFRDYGFYWIRLKGERWIVGEWVGDGWLITRSRELVRDEEVAQVSENRLAAPDQYLIPSYMKAVPRVPNVKIQDALAKLEGALEGR